LADELYLGKYDTAIVPVFEYLRHASHYTYLDAPVIAARDAVLSVMLYSSAPLAKLKTVYLDKSSLTSVHLFKVLAAEGNYSPQYIDTGIQPAPKPLPPDTGIVLIGDPAIEELGKHPFQLDLGAAWFELTSLPFVFAAWLVPNHVRKPGLAELLNESYEVALANFDQMARESAAQFEVSPEFALRYFSEHILYRLGDEELAGWKEFARLCHKHRLIPSLPEFRVYCPK